MERSESKQMVSPALTNSSPWQKVKTGVAIAVGIVALLCLGHIFSSSWTYKAPTNENEEKSNTIGAIEKETLLALAKQNHKLTVGKVHIKASGWHTRDKKQFFKTHSAVRGWTVPTQVDVVIDMDKLNEDSFDLLTDDNGNPILTIKLPYPEIEERQVSALQPDELCLVLNDGAIESDEYRTFKKNAFMQIRDNIRKTVNQNLSTIIEMAKTSAAQAFCSFYASLGITKVVVTWASMSSDQEISVNSPNSQLYNDNPQ